jgi:AraC-like DNA-binding protein
LAKALIEDVHLTATPAAARGMLSRDALARVIDCIHAGFERQLSVDELADAAQQSQSHFPRLLRRSVGMSPYQYVIKVRLKRALAMLPNRKSLDGGDRRSDGLRRPERDVPLDATSVRRGPHTAGSKAPPKRRNLQAKRRAASHLTLIRCLHSDEISWRRPQTYLPLSGVNQINNDVYQEL